jgi:predicted ArsR family transcriptional regulator
MDEKMNKTMTVLESIIQDVSQALFQKWANALPEDQRTDENIKNLSNNSTDTTYFVVKMFMDRFNEAAAELKPIDEAN